MQIAGSTGRLGVGPRTRPSNKLLGDAGAAGVVPTLRTTVLEEQNHTGEKTEG